MGWIAGRDELERNLARAISREYARFLRVSVGEITSMEQLSKFDRAVLREHNERMTAAIQPQLHGIYTAQGEALLSEIGVAGVDIGGYNVAAADWARQYSSALVYGMSETTSEILRRAIAAYFQQSMTQAQLRELLAPSFGPVRAEMIAITETTRAAVEGERQMAAALYAESGIKTRPIWKTMNDELVCPICGPRNEQEIRGDNVTMGEYPPAHPRCRCGVGYEIVT